MNAVLLLYSLLIFLVGVLSEQVSALYYGGLRTINGERGEASPAI